MVQKPGSTRSIRSILHSQLSPLRGMSLLLAAVLVSVSCSNDNDEGPSQADDAEARAEYWSDLDNEEVEKANTAFDALVSCEDSALVSSIEVTDE